MTTVKLKEYPGFVWTRTICDCGQPNCSLDLLFEMDDYGYTSISLSGEFRTYSLYHHRGWFRRQIWKIKTAIKLLFTGNVELEADIVLQQKETEQFLKMVQDCADQIKSQKKEP